MKKDKDIYIFNPTLFTGTSPSLIFLFYLYVIYYNVLLSNSIELLSVLQSNQNNEQQQSGPVVGFGSGYKKFPDHPSKLNLQKNTKKVYWLFFRPKSLFLVFFFKIFCQFSCTSWSICKSVAWILLKTKRWY